MDLSVLSVLVISLGGIHGHWPEVPNEDISWCDVSGGTGYIFETASYFSLSPQTPHVVVDAPDSEPGSCVPGYDRCQFQVVVNTDAQGDMSSVFIRLGVHEHDPTQFRRVWKFNKNKAKNKVECGGVGQDFNLKDPEDFPHFYYDHLSDEENHPEDWIYGIDWVATTDDGNAIWLVQGGGECHTHRALIFSGGKYVELMYLDFPSEATGLCNP